MSFNSASLVLASSGPYRLWLYSTEDNLASLTTATIGLQATDYFKNANVATLSSGQMGIRRGDIILAANAASQVVTPFGFTYADNQGSVTAQASIASAAPS